MDDTRDIAIETRAEVRALKDLVAGNTVILKDLHADFLRRQERGALFKTGVALAKSVPAGAVGAAAMWIINHAPFVPR
jgi:hypothetical protein